jgi:hypothetical protein
MDLTIIKHTEKVHPYRMSNFVHVALKSATFLFTVYLSCQAWSFVSLIYVILLLYWMGNMDRSMSTIKNELLKKKGGKRYDNLVKMTFSNPHLRFYYKMLYIVVLVMILKVIGSFIGSMNYVKGFDTNNLRTQIMLDLEVSDEQVESFKIEHLYFQDSLGKCYE